MVAQFPEDSRQVVRSQNEDGTWNFAQVDIAEISYKGRFGTLAESFSSNSISIGIKSFLLIEDRDIRVGDDIQMIALGDTRVFMWGEVISRTTNDEGGTVLGVFIDDLSSVGTGETYDFWEIQVVARPKPGIEKDTSTTSIDPTGNGPFTFTVSTGKFFPVGGQLLIKPTTNRTIALTGTVVSYASDQLMVKKGSCNTTASASYTSWSIALLDAPPIDTPLRSFSASNVSVGSGTKTFTVDAGKFFPVNSSVLVRDTARTDNYMYGTVTNYTDTTLTTSITAVFGSGSSSTWDILLLDGPGALYSNISEDWGFITAGTSNSEDYRLITLAVAESEDYDLITAAVTTSADYGTVV